VSPEGDPQCNCFEPFAGDRCEECDSKHVGDNCQFEKCEDEEMPQCGQHGDCYYPDQGSNDTLCYCDHGFHGDNCEDNSTTAEPISSTTTEPVSSKSAVSSLPPEITTSPADKDTESSPSLDGDAKSSPSLDKDAETTSEGAHIIASSPHPNNTLLYGGLIVFIAFLVVCVAAYLAYHNKEKIFELFGGKKESVVEMAMRSRTKSKGYKKLPTSIHDTLTHED